MTLIIENVKEEHLSVFKEFANKMKVSLRTEADDEKCAYGYSHIPNDETIKALQECEAGGNGKIYASYDEFVKEIEQELADEAKS